MACTRWWLALILGLVLVGCESTGSLVTGDDDDSGPADDDDASGDDDDVSDDDASDDDVSDDDAGDDDAGDDDAEPNPLIGSIYVQDGGIGYASYHFDAENDVYISYGNAPGNWVMDNGQHYPDRKAFIDIEFHIPDRVFQGTIDWSSPENTTAGGAETWIYEMIFSPDYETISGGYVKAFSPGGQHLTTYYFGSDLVYWLF